jgi:transcription initiation factor TFIIIB Brf1 subunit/transcription initiation factor TFIIB
MNNPMTSLSLEHQCRSCQSLDIIDDYSTGDSICRDCGLVYDQLMITDYKLTTHSETYSSSNSSSYESMVRRFCERNQFDENTIQCVIEYITNNQTKLGMTNQWMKELKPIIFAIHLIETNDNIHTFMKKRKMDTNIIEQLMNEIKMKYRMNDSQNLQQPTDTKHQEWVQTLYNEIIQKSQYITNVPKRTIIEIKKEIQRLVDMRPEALFYNSSVLSTVLLLKHKIPVEHKLPSSKIRKITKELFV